MRMDELIREYAKVAGIHARTISMERPPEDAFESEDYAVFFYLGYDEEDDRRYNGERGTSRRVAFRNKMRLAAEIEKRRESNMFGDGVDH